jgi:hypothetical protein
MEITRPGLLVMLRDLQYNRIAPGSANYLDLRPSDVGAIYADTPTATRTNTHRSYRSQEHAERWAKPVCQLVDRVSNFKSYVQSGTGAPKYSNSAISQSVVLGTVADVYH